MAKFTSKVLEKVADERMRQDAKWGETDHTGFTWVSIIGEEYGEMCHATNEYSFNPSYDAEEIIYREAVQTAASCVALCECIERARERNAEFYGKLIK